MTPSAGLAVAVRLKVKASPTKATTRIREFAACCQIAEFAYALRGGRRWASQNEVFGSNVASKAFRGVYLAAQRCRRVPGNI